MKRKMRYGKTMSRRERSPGRHHEDKYKSSKRRYNSKEKHTSHHRSRTPQKRPRYLIAKFFLFRVGINFC